jgi:CMP-N-acetylneuraminic acid synthetase
MFTQHKILGVILARDNLRGGTEEHHALNGHALIGYSIYAALNCKYIEELIVSTEDGEIAEISKEYGAQVPFMRPGELAKDDVWSRDALKHAVLEAEKYFDKVYDFVVEVPAVAPLRDAEDITGALEKLIVTGADSVISVCKVQDKHPVRMKRIVDDRLGDFTTEFPEGESSRRQDLEPCYVRNGAIYAMKRSTIIDNFSRVGKVSRPFIMPEEKSVNIDTNVDLCLAEALIKKGLCNNWPVRILPKTVIEKFPNPRKPKMLFSSAYEFLPVIKRHLIENYDVTFAFNAPRPKVVQMLEGKEIWVTATCPPYFIDKELIEISPKLKIIATPSTGTNHFDFKYAISEKITVLSLKDAPVIEDIHASAEFSSHCFWRWSIKSHIVTNGKDGCLAGKRA